MTLYKVNSKGGKMRDMVIRNRDAEHQVGYVQNAFSLQKWPKIRETSKMMRFLKDLLQHLIAASFAFDNMLDAFAVTYMCKNMLLSKIAIFQKPLQLR